MRTVDIGAGRGTVDIGAGRGTVDELGEAKPVEERLTPLEQSTPGYATDILYKNTEISSSQPQAHP